MFNNNQQSSEDKTSDFNFSSYQQLTDPTFIKLKLDTSPLLQRVEAFISAKRVVIMQDSSGNYYEDIKTIGQPYANDEGTSAILSMIDLRANNHSVQGNTIREECKNFLADTRIELTEVLVLNCYEWGISETKLNMIIDTIMAYLNLFISRTIDNKERLSLMAGFQSKEVISQVDKSKALKNFTDGIGK